MGAYLVDFWVVAVVKEGSQCCPGREDDDQKATHGQASAGPWCDDAIHHSASRRETLMLVTMKEMQMEKKKMMKRVES